MSSLAVTNSIFFDFESSMRQQLETQEAESYADLKARETEMCEVKEKSILNERLIEELRPLCEELPPDALDPVTYESFKSENVPLVLKCGHTLNRSTIQHLASERIQKDKGIHCPSCKSMIYKNHLSECVNLEGLTEYAEKITKIFQKHSGRSDE